jgi:hypothetical protein
LLAERIAEINVRVGVIGPQRQRLRVVPYGFIRPALHREGISEIVVRLREIGLQGDRDPKACDGFVVAIQYCEHIGKIVVRLDRTRVLPGPGAEQPDGVIEPALLRMQQTEIVKTIEVGFIDLQNGAIQLLRFA